MLINHIKRIISKREKSLDKDQTIFLQILQYLEGVRYKVEPDQSPVGEMIVFDRMHIRVWDGPKLQYADNSWREISMNDLKKEIILYATMMSTKDLKDLMISDVDTGQIVKPLPQPDIKLFKEFVEEFAEQYSREFNPTITVDKLVQEFNDFISFLSSKECVLYTIPQLIRAGRKPFFQSTLQTKEGDTYYVKYVHSGEIYDNR